MSSITSLNNSSYYQLSDPSAGAGGNSTQSNFTNPLLQALSSSSSSNDQSASSPSDAYLLDLSPAAQQLMNAGNSASAVSPVGSSSDNFTLTTSQQQTIASILEKYKDSPYTQATFDSIQNDLQAAGLDPATLSRENAAQSFSPVELLVDDLNGNSSDANAMLNPDESAKSNNYIQGIINEWKEMSGNTGSTSTSDAVAATRGAS